MNVSVCLCVCVCVCVFVCPRSYEYLRNYTSDLHQFLCMLPMAVDRSSCGGVVIRYVLPVLWMTSYFAHKVARRRRPAESQCTRSLGRGYKLYAVIPFSGERSHGRLK